MLKISNKSRHTKKQYKKRNYSKKSKKNKNKKNKNNSKKMKGGTTAIPTPTAKNQRAEQLRQIKEKRALLRKQKQKMTNSVTQSAINELINLDQFLDTSFETHKKRLELSEKYGAFNYPNNYQKINLKKKIKQNYPVRKNHTIKTLKSLNTYWGSNKSKRNSVFQFNPTKVKPQFKPYQNFELQLR